LNIKDIEGKIKDDLKKSGFFSEMVALDIFKRRGWSTTGVASYYDLDQEKTRESDINAYIYSGDEAESKASIHFNVVAEVKKSEKPWIVFKEIPKYTFQISEAWNSVIFKTGISQVSDELTDSLRKNTLTSEMNWIGSGIHEFKKNPDQPSRWFSSIISICKAAEYSLEKNKWEEDKNDSPYIFFVKPIIILDGTLISAEIDNQEIHLEEIESATIDFEFQTPHYTRGRYKVDIVTIDNLSAYLELCENRKNKIFTQLKIL
jgi:hypothetical protein